MKNKNDKNRKYMKYRNGEKHKKSAIKVKKNHSLKKRKKKNYRKDKNKKDTN